MPPRSHQPLILASASPRRRELLAQVGVPIEVHPSQADEPPHEEGDPGEYCVATARAKAEEVAGRFPGRFVLGADTVVILEGRALGKPQDEADGARMLRALAGREHEVMTAFTLIGPEGRRVERAARTKVWFKRLSEVEIAGYLATGEPMDKAGAYGIQGIGTFAVASIDGSYSAVVGLPVAEVLEALAELDGPAPFTAQGG